VVRTENGEPERSNHELGRINREDDEDLAGARHASKITEAVSVKIVVQMTVCRM